MGRMSVHLIATAVAQAMACESVKVIHSREGLYGIGSFTEPLPNSPYNPELKDGQEWKGSGKRKMSKLK